MYIFIYMYVCIYIYTHIHTHIYLYILQINQSIEASTSRDRLLPVKLARRLYKPADEPPNVMAPPLDAALLRSKAVLSIDIEDSRQ